MAEGREEAALSFSMRMTVYGIQKAFPSVRNVSCNDVEEWRRGAGKKLVCVVSFGKLGLTVANDEAIKVACVSHVQDVRPEEEFNVSHIPGAVRVDPSSQPDLQTLGITSDTTGERAHYVPSHVSQGLHIVSAYV